MTDPTPKKEPQGSRVFSRAKTAKRPLKYRELNRQLNKLTGEQHLIFVPGYN